MVTNQSSGGWATRHTNTESPPASSPTPLDDKVLPSFENSKYDDIVQTTLDPLLIASHRFDFPDPSFQASPTSSNEAEPDLDRLDDSSDWEHPQGLFDSPQNHPTAYKSFSFGPVPSPDSSNSEANSFADTNMQKENKEMDTEEISLHNSKTTHWMFDGSQSHATTAWEPVSPDWNNSDPFADTNIQKGTKDMVEDVSNAVDEM